ncbi:MAG: hypothetical protein CVT62_00390 [Actinobacteria bacterium HGW-Actinobacteria-2]|nr:MAG: hypothetical protein CVT62_00390 [Actinobacteria bacterium HGW-Actinobacteria-2]
MSDPRARRARQIGANVAAAASGALVATTANVPLLARIPLTVMAGTLGFLVGGAVAAMAVSAIRRVRWARPGALVYDLHSLPPDTARAGGKARALASLTQRGFPVPPACVVLPEAFTGADLTSEGRVALEAALTKLRGERFAVRSSARAEDSATASFAGAFESELNVPRQDVLAAVKRVRSSGASQRVAAYSAAQHAGSAEAELAVVIQVMVDADVAGVLFTVDPLTGSLESMLGNVVTGSGEALVSGDADAAAFTFLRPQGTYDGPASLATAAARLHTLAHDIEGCFDGVAQDIEWALADGKVWILQSRPITTLNGWDPMTAERNDTLSGNCLWSATNLSEANPEPQTPLTISLTSYLQDNGGPSMKLRGREMAGYVAGRPYANLSVQVSARGPKAISDPRTVYEQIAGLWGTLPPQVPIPVLPLTRADWQDEGLGLLATVLRLQWHRARIHRFLAVSAPEAARLKADINEISTPADLEALWRNRIFAAALRSFWAVIAVTDDRLDPVEAAVRELVDTDDAAALLSNMAGLSDGLASLGPAMGLQAVRAGQLSREDYLLHFGHRGYNEIELAWARPSEDPDWLDRALASSAEGADLTALRAERAAAHQAVLARLRSQHPRAAARIERGLHRRATRAALREQVRSESVRWTAVHRAFALRAGHLLNIGESVFLLTLPELLSALRGDTSAFTHFPARQATLDHHRSLPPLPLFIVGAFNPDLWAQDPHRRSDFYIAGSQVPAPTESAAATVVGAAGSVGVAVGRVRRLDGFDDAAELLPGEVLVTALTNIGWTPVFGRASAIVTDLGAPLSHAAIVAREFGIPAVVGCGSATSRLTTGDLVRVDGARGTVEILERGA